MKIVDLTSSYVKNILINNDLEEYKKSFPEFFDHYFKYWADEKKFKPVLAEVELEKNRKVVLDILPEIERRLEKIGLPTPSDNQIILFVGQHSSNGHSFRYKNKFITWIALEGYRTKLDVEAFVTHEIAHSLLYEKNKNEIDKLFNEDRLYFRLISEGFATYISKKAFNLSDEDALWASYLSKEKKIIWIKKCRQEEKNLFKMINDRMGEKIQKGSELYDLFNITDKYDIYKNRAGYYIALKLFEKNKLIKKNLIIPRVKL